MAGYSAVTPPPLLEFSICRWKSSLVLTVSVNKDYCLFIKKLTKECLVPSKLWRLKIDIV